MLIYHVTSRESGEAIQREGFRDGEGSYGFATLSLKGVWIANVPLSVNDMGKRDDWIIVLDVSDQEVQAFKDYEIIEELNGYREWCVPAETLNTFPIVDSGSRDEGRFEEAIYG